MKGGNLEDGVGGREVGEGGLFEISVLHLRYEIILEKQKFNYKPFNPPSKSSTSYSSGYVSNTLFNSRLSLSQSWLISAYTSVNISFSGAFFLPSAAANAVSTSFRILERVSRSFASSQRPLFSSHFLSRVIGLSRRFQSSTSTLAR